MASSPDCSSNPILPYCISIVFKFSCSPALELFSEGNSLPILKLLVYFLTLEKVMKRDRIACCCPVGCEIWRFGSVEMPPKACFSTPDLLRYSDPYRITNIPILFPSSRAVHRRLRSLWEIEEMIGNAVSLTISLKDAVRTRRIELIRNTVRLISEALKKRVQNRLERERRKSSPRLPTREGC